MKISKSLFKKIGAVLLTAIMVLAMGIPTFADSKKTVTGTPSAEDVGKVTISGLEAGDAVEFYQIVKAEYDNGFTGYKAVKDGNISLFREDNGSTVAIYPSAEQVIALSKDTAGLTKVGPVAAADGKVEQDLALGEWLVLVKAGTTDTVYNPMVVSVYYTDENSGNIIVGKDLALGENTKYSINSSEAFVKKTKLENEKTITGNTDNDAQRTKGDDLGLDDVINFKITTRIPAYSEEYFTTDEGGTTIISGATFEISDNMDAGLDYIKNTNEIKSTVIKVHGVDADSNNYILTEEDHGFRIVFEKAYLKSLGDKTDAEREVEVTYSAKLNADATVNYDANMNKSTVIYTHDPDLTTKEMESETYQYTFAIDGNINGSKKTKNRKGHELIKVNEKGEPVGEPQWINDGTSETTIEQGLAGATFRLVQIKNNKGEDLSPDEQTKHTYTATTDENGYFNGFNHLDAGTYTLKEIEAPAGYSLNTEEHTVVISATYAEDGKLQTFTISIDGQKSTTYSARYDNKEIEEIITIGDPETYYIKNTKMGVLPSTGGIGTYLFTFIGVAIMATVAGGVRNSRKRKVNK